MVTLPVLVVLVLPGVKVIVSVNVLRAGMSSEFCEMVNADGVVTVAAPIKSPVLPKL